MSDDATRGVPTPNSFWEVPVFTFLPTTVVARSILSLGKGRDAEPQVALDCDGRWNHGEPDRLAVLISPESALELADNIRSAALAAISDMRWQR